MRSQNRTAILEDFRTIVCCVLGFNINSTSIICLTANNFIIKSRFHLVFVLESRVLFIKILADPVKFLVRNFCETNNEYHRTRITMTGAQYSCSRIHEIHAVLLYEVHRRCPVFRGPRRGTNQWDWNHRRGVVVVVVVG